MKFVKFSKPSKDMQDIRKSFFSENKKFLKIAKKANSFTVNRKFVNIVKIAVQKFRERFFHNFMHIILFVTSVLISMVFMKTQIIL